MCLEDKEQFAIHIVSRKQWCLRDTSEDKFNKMDHVVGTPIIENNGAMGYNREQWCHREDKLKDHVFNVDPCAWGGFCESVGAFTMITVYENELNVALEKGEPGVLMSEYGLK
ncbi:hypothetical protein ACFE04_013462 [Oxalis oulophora]